VEGEVRGTMKTQKFLEREGLDSRRTLGAGKEEEVQKIYKGSEEEGNFLSRDVRKPSEGEDQRERKKKGRPSLGRERRGKKPCSRK